ncbi:MAG: Crp/Fnr family transcriptional regulator [Bacteroidetes bacterium]|nr:Crp/Fnr family transcriptional regulator [Bacteroidota bacterium]
MKYQTLEAFKKYLQQFPHYSQNAFESALPYLKEVRIAPGDYLLEHGKVCRNIAFIESGLFRMYYLNDGKEITTCFCKENTLTCSYRSLITKQPSETAIQAIEDSNVYVFSYENLQTLYTKDLFWQQVGRLAAESEFINTECHNRFINDLSATERYMQLLENDHDLFQRVPLHYLASYMQVAPETLSRIRKKISLS